MRKAIKVRAFVAMFLLGIAATTGAYAETRDPETNFFDQNFGNLKDEAATAKQEGKRGIFIMFEQDSCPWCAKMMATVLNQAAVQDYYRRYFRIIHIDMKGDDALTDFHGKDTTEKDFAFAQRVRATPVFAFFDTEGNLLTRYTGAAKDADEFLLLGKFVVDGDYKAQNFTAYKRAHSR